MGRAVDITAPGGRIEHRRPRLGDLHWDGGVWRRWSGRRWARAVASPAPVRLLDPRPLDADPPLAPSSSGGSWTARSRAR
ncbi:hypothetical protein [Nocardioides houyundeii]|uniref:hypothetical protein n=1 Tax=Nocardioides houyundeii TaxID=2045452 RepID=UPI0013157D18|nr:hypothetical protein [Nocardioides houyundeii]